MGKYNILIIICLLPFYLNAEKLHIEKWYQDKYCLGKIEAMMPDKTRCDCLTDTHAIEFDFGVSWAAAIGQSLHYGFQTIID
ncbi:MAG: hypothetical protein WD512_19455 [Candidatus Paceibacterota bacterium]